MSKSLDTLNKAVAEVITSAAGKSFTKEALVELIDDNIGFLRNDLMFFNSLGPASEKLRGYMAQNGTNNKLQSIVIYNKINGSINTTARKANTERFLGAFVDTLAGLVSILEECNNNIDQIFVDKNITIFNTKISQIAVLGMIDNARVFSQFVIDYISLFMADRSSLLFKPAPYALKGLEDAQPTVIDLINRVTGNKLNKSFVNSIKRYRGAGVDTGVVNNDNKASTQFAKVNNDVTDSDITAGAKGLMIFKIIGDWFVDRTDTKIRKLRAERDMLQARAQLLQLELDGSDENSPEYKRQAEIIKNYQKLIDRLNQKIAKLEE